MTGNRIAALERAMEVAESKGAKKRIEEEMEKAAGREKMLHRTVCESQP